MPTYAAASAPAINPRYEAPPEERLVPTRMDQGCGILIISAVPEDHVELHRILDGPLKIVDAATYTQGIRNLGWGRFAVVICESRLPDGSWKDVLSHGSELIVPPVLIVTSCDADSQLRAEVEDLGGFHVLSKPFRPNEVFNVVAAALRGEKLGAEGPPPA
jgi:DNA-binding response OmpR family regulator